MPRPTGVLIDDATWDERKSDWLPSTEDGDFIASLMKPVTEAGAVRRLDLAAEGRHRQQAGRFRVREDRDVSTRLFPQAVGLRGEVGA